MNIAGPMTFSYVVSRNLILMKKIEDLSKTFKIALWVGDENMIRSNQLDFVYKCINNIFRSPLRTLLCNEDNTKKIVTEVIPKYICYRELVSEVNVYRQKGRQHLAAL